MNGAALGPTSAVDVAKLAGEVLITDAKDHGGGRALHISYPDWHDFLCGAPIEGLSVSEHDRVTGHDGAWVHTRWHLCDGRGGALHFTDAEWTAFWADVLDSELGYPRLLLA